MGMQGIVRGLYSGIQEYSEIYRGVQGYTGCKEVSKGIQSNIGISRGVQWYLTLYRQRFSLRKTHFLPLKQFLKCYGAKCH